MALGSKRALIGWNSVSGIMLSISGSGRSQRRAQWSLQARNTASRQKGLVRFITSLKLEVINSPLTG